ncbi:MAG: hypothetical protein Q4C13_05130 [Clostridia bacterium]|nr:hypothetical protein [Clostridia bacterium]
MKLSAPKGIIWWIALILAVIGVLTKIDIVPSLFGSQAFCAMATGYVLLFLGTLFKGL